jgi:hypothetical protein
MTESLRSRPAAVKPEPLQNPRIVEQINRLRFLFFLT